MTSTRLPPDTGRSQRAAAWAYILRCNQRKKAGDSTPRTPTTDGKKPPRLVYDEEVDM